MPHADRPTRAELVLGAAGAVPVLRGLPAWSPSRPGLSEETIAVLADAGAFRLRAPRSHGGYECDTRTLVSVAVELGRASGAAAWTACAYWVPTWLAAGFGDRARGDVFASRDVRVCGALSEPARATPAAGGLVVDGRWALVPGVLHATWQVVVSAAGGDPVAALVPLADLRVVDGLVPGDVTGAGGAGVVAHEVFVPAHRVAPLSTVVGKRAAPLAAVTAASWVGAVVGMAQDARDWYFDELATDHGPSFAGGDPRAVSAMAHVPASSALTALTRAERCAHRLAAMVDNESGAWELARDTLDAACRLAGDAVHILAAVSGPASPIRRIARDLDAATGHLLTETGIDSGVGIDSGRWAAAVPD